MCRICFSQAALGDFETSGAAKMAVSGQASSCCGLVLINKHILNILGNFMLISVQIFRYGNAGSAAASAYDCLVIPNAVTEDGVPAHSV